MEESWSAKIDFNSHPSDSSTNLWLLLLLIQPAASYLLGRRILTPRPVFKHQQQQPDSR